MLLKFAYQDFMEDRKFKNTTESNIKNYKILLGGFISYCQTKEIINLEDISSSTIKSFLLECQEKGNKAGTINSKLLRIRAFLNYMVESEYLKISPAKKIKLLILTKQVQQPQTKFRNYSRKLKKYLVK